MNLGPWKTQDFDTLSWHDIHVHGFRFASFDEEEGAADIVFDIDYILKWGKFGDKYIFSVCPAELTFHKAFRLKMEVDYLTPTAGMCPWAIETIDRVPLEFATGFKSYRWSISINWPRGSFQFESPEFTLELRGKPVLRSDQWLSSEDRAFK